MKQVIDSSHIMLTTLNILGARLLLACSHSLASLQCVSSDLRLTCCSILSLIMLLFLSLPRSFKPRANKMLMKLADWVASNLFCRSLFLLIASSHSLCFYIIWFSAARWEELTHRRRMIRTIFHCTVQLRLQVDSTGQMRCRALTIASLYVVRLTWSALFHSEGLGRLTHRHVRLPSHFLRQLEQFSETANTRVRDSNILLCGQPVTYLEPFILFDNPSGYHVIVCVLIRGAKVDCFPPVWLEAFFKYIL